MHNCRYIIHQLQSQIGNSEQSIAFKKEQKSEAAADIELDAVDPNTDSEVFSISFVANDQATPIQTVGEFKVG